METASGKYGWEKVVPIQLFEAIFLFLLAAFLFMLVWKKKGFGLSGYLIGYGVWRFVIEFFRTDDRGASFIPGLTPSQVTAILMVLIGVVLIAAYYIIRKKKGQDVFIAPDLKENSKKIAEGKPSGEV